MLYQHNMIFEHYLLLIIAIFPFLYKYNFWFYVIQLKEYRWDRFKEYLYTPQGNSALINVWSIVELPLFLLSFYVFFNEPFEIILYNVIFYYLLIENLFIIRKFFKRNILKPKITGRLLLLEIILILGISYDLSYIAIYEYSNAVYLYILFLFLFAPLIIFFVNILTLPIVFILKKLKINKAIKKSLDFKKPIKIGITGSYGKSSVKEFLSSILEQDGETLKTPENINTELGVSKLVLNKLSDKYKYFVAEMGAYRIGEIDLLGKIVNHKYGFLTAIGNQHLGLFGSLENIKKGKSEIANSVLKNNGTLYINWNNKEIRNTKFNEKLKIVKYGNHKGADTSYKIIGIKNGKTEFEFDYKGKKRIFKTKITGEHNIINITGVLAFCYDLGLKTHDLKSYVKHLKAPKNTLHIIENKKNTLIDDSHNLSEAGLFAGLDVLNSYEGEKILVMDDILELGKESKSIHYEIGKKIAKKKLIDKILYAGINYRTDFFNGLFDGGYNTDIIINKIDTQSKNSIILFEGRGTGKYLNNIIKNV